MKTFVILVSKWNREYRKITISWKSDNILANKLSWHRYKISVARYNELSSVSKQKKYTKEISRNRSHAYFHVIVAHRQAHCINIVEYIKKLSLNVSETDTYSFFVEMLHAFLYMSGKPFFSDEKLFQSGRAWSICLVNYFTVFYILVCLSLLINGLTSAYNWVFNFIHILFSLFCFVTS